MSSTIHQTVRAWDGSYRVPRMTAEDAGRAGRFVVAAILAVGLLYCGSIAWDVLQDLRAIKLVELRSVLHRVSVGDAILTWLAWVIGRDLLRALLRG